MFKHTDESSVVADQLRDGNKLLSRITVHREETYKYKQMESNEIKRTRFTRGAETSTKDAPVRACPLESLDFYLCDKLHSRLLRFIRHAHRNDFKMKTKSTIELFSRCSTARVDFAIFEFTSQSSLIFFAQSGTPQLRVRLL